MDKMFVQQVNKVHTSHLAKLFIINEFKSFLTVILWAKTEKIDEFTFGFEIGTGTELSLN